MPLEVWLPMLNTGLIVVSGLCLLVGVFFIKRKNIPAHKASMLTATAFAGLFLIVYVTRYLVLGETAFDGEGAIRTAYFALLIGHIILAISLVPLVLVTLRRALKEDFSRHKRIARWTFPVWLIVAASGWLVYWMLYRM